MPHELEMVTVLVAWLTFGCAILVGMAVRALGLLLITQLALGAWCTASAQSHGRKLGAKESKA